jgi:hypothetical protein
MTATQAMMAPPSRRLEGMWAIGASVMSDLRNEVPDVVSRCPLPGDPVADVAADATSGAARGNRAPAAVPDQRALCVH